jgi:cell division transport system permease protein
MSRPGDEHGPLVDLGHERPLVPARARNLSPIVPRASIAGRALVAVVAIMTFLASLTAGAVVLVRGAAGDWQSDLAREITIQVRPVSGQDIEAQVQRAVDLARQTPGIGEVRPYSKAESSRLLEPWLGSGLVLDDLPVPRIIVVRLAPGQSADLAQLRTLLTQQVAGASLDDHRAWIERMRAMAQTSLFGGIAVLLLVLAATVLSVAFATRGAMATNRPIIEVLHFIGAKDGYIAGQFQRHFLVLGLEGGVIGGGATILLFALMRVASNWGRATASGDQLSALFGNFSIGIEGYIAVVTQIVVIAAVTAYTSRQTVNRTLQTIE